MKIFDVILKTNTGEISTKKIASNSRHALNEKIRRGTMPFNREQIIKIYEGESPVIEYRIIEMLLNGRKVDMSVNDRKAQAAYCLDLIGCLSQRINIDGNLIER